MFINSCNSCVSRLRRQASSQKHIIATIIFINEAPRPAWQHSCIRSSIKKASFNFHSKFLSSISDYSSMKKTMRFSSPSTTITNAVENGECSVGKRCEFER